MELAGRIARLYLPLALSLLSLILLFAVKVGSGTSQIKLNLWVVEFDIPIANLLVVRIVLAVLVFAFLLLYLSYDYSKLFPQQFKMEVFYDEGGIQDSLHAFSQAQLDSLGIPKDFLTYRREYFAGLDSEINRSLGNFTPFFTAKGGTVHSEGSACITIEKIGLQKYHVKASKGELTNRLEVPNSEPKEFRTGNEKLDSNYDYINLRLGDVLHANILLRTQYKQFLQTATGAQGARFQRVLVGVTRVTVFPWPDLSKTVYLAKFEGVGLIPVAYAALSPSGP